MKAVMSPHSTTSAPGLALEVEVRRTGRSLGLEYRLTGAIEAVIWPERAPCVRTDGLWRTTCFEVFVRTEGGYVEFNLSPSGAWAAYGFDGYRQGMTPHETSAPMIVGRRSADGLILMADLVLPSDAVGPLGVSAVIGDRDGGLSCWALAHPSDKPDFHHPDSFVLDL